VSAMHDRDPADARRLPAIAFFDVDETLVATKTMFDFLEHYCDRHPELDRVQLIDQLERLRRAGTSREQINRAYYAFYAGANWLELLAEGRAWYAALCRQPAPFIGATIRALRRHRAAGDRVVLVSGSFLACLLPLAGHLNVDAIHCTRLEIDEAGRLTGKTGMPVIGEAKAAVARAEMARARVPAQACFAYGDHASDLALLRSVGQPRVVGDDPVLTRHAHQHGWARLAAARAPAPAPSNDRFRRPRRAGTQHPTVQPAREAHR